MFIQAPTVGPIIGAVGTNNARIWARGDLAKNDRCFGVARIRRAGVAGFGPAKIFKMKPVFDFTGIVNFDNLVANQRYDYQVGYFFGGGDLANVTIDWRDATAGTFKTAVKNSSDDLSFVFGSCRYLLRLFGGSLFDDRGDKIFRSIQQQIDAGRDTEFMLMVGDQIYADDLNILAPDTQVDQFFSRYKTVFSQAHIRKLMANTPTYMILDDHEISNDWHQDRATSESNLLASALHAYQCYQFVHGPGFEVGNKKDVSDTPDKLWYRFRRGKSSFFVMDTRTERIPSGSPPQMISSDQMAIFKSWLSAGEQKNQTKFVVTSVPFFPDPVSGAHDKWAGFSVQRKEILDYIRKQKIGKVVFLSGDVHCSMSGQLRHPEDPAFLVTSVVSSSFFWPMWQGRASGFSLKGDLDQQNNAGYQLTGFGKVHSKDNFTRLTVNGDKLKVETYERKGALLGRRILGLK
jgi:alkaline phosphatase D